MEREATCPDQAPTGRLQRLEIAVVAGPSRGALHRPKGVSTRVGSSVDAGGLTLNDPKVSRQHCEFRVLSGRIRLIDLGSTNGTWVQGLRIRDVDLPPGAMVRLGDSQLRVLQRDEPPALPLSTSTHFGELLGESAPMRAVFSLLERAARSDATVLLVGETGTGKDVAARSLHAASPRSQGPWIPLDCSAITPSLFESELFGHVRGAFTGAHDTRRGAFEEADGGTLFLDEIGELPLDLQAKLLRAVETRAIRRVGESRERPVDVRLICATHRDLLRLVNEGRFREDLYFRLAVVEVELPPLRERPEDILPLAERFIAKLRPGVDASRLLTPELRARAWRGNVRELRNVVERQVVLYGDELFADGAPPETHRAAAPGPRKDLPLKEAREQSLLAFDTQYAEAILAETGGNISEAARRAGVSRRYLQRLLARLGASPEEDVHR